MLAVVEHEGVNYKLDLSKPLDVSIPIRFDEQQMTSFGASPATAVPFQAGSFTGSVESGAGANCDVITFSAHLHGTHTECVGHISNKPIFIQDVANTDGYFLAAVVTVEPEHVAETSEKYEPVLENGDRLITRAALDAANIEACAALMVRTAPNDVSKMTGESAPAFFTNDAMAYIVELGIEHLLIDTPSVDRLEDNGALTNHHIFWGVEQGSHDIQTPSSKTITEHIYVADEIKDGLYMMSLQVAPIRSDASPSRPILFEMEKK